MAKEKRSGWASAIHDFVIPSIKDTLTNSVHTFVHRTQDILYKTQERLLEKLIIALLFFCGIVILLLSVGFLMIEYLRLSFGWSFFIVGLLLLLVAALLNIHFAKHKKYTFEVKP